MSRREGYVTEIDYTNRLCREQGPAWLSLAALWSGAAAPRLDREFTLLELGCGHGGNAVLAASLFPQAQFLANDFLPAHVESACVLRDAAGIGNLTVLPDSFADMARRDDLPDCDFIVAHGIFSWVSVQNQTHILDIVRRRLKPGGLFYVSYNNAVGWAGMGGLRQLLIAHVERDTGPLIDRMQRALDRVAHFAGNGPGIATLDNLAHCVQALRQEDPAYLVHEYLNENWQPLYAPQVAAMMAQAGLSYVGSAQLADTLDATALPPSLLPYMRTQPAGPLRELMGDITLNRPFRADIYGRDVPRLAGDALARRRDAVRFVLAAPPDQCHPVIALPFHVTSLDPAAQAAVLERLATESASLATLGALPALRALAPDTVLQMLTLMVQAGHLCAVPGDAGVDAAGAAALNQALVAHARQGRATSFLAAPAIAGSVTTALIDTLLLGAALDGEADLAGRVWRDIAALGQSVPWGDGMIAADAAGLTILGGLADRFRQEMVPRLRLFGILPS